MKTNKGKSKKRNTILKIGTFLKRKFWYITLITISSVYVYNYRFEVLELKEINAMNLIFLLWLFLLLFPLISEMEFLGVKIKKEVEKATGEINESLDGIKTQLSVIQQVNWMNSQENRVYNQITIPNYPKLTNEDLEKSKNAKNEAQNQSAEDLQSEIDSKSFNNIIRLAYVSRCIESKLQEICKLFGITNEYTISQMLSELFRIEAIDGETLDLIRKTISITSWGLDGHPVSDEYVDYALKTRTQIITKLDNIKSNLHIIACPRCKYQGYSMFENQCPQCGMVFCDD